MQYAYYEDDGDERNGDPFKSYIEPTSINYDNISEATIRISKYKYSNYTIGKEYAEKSINYVKFWNEEEIDDKSVNGRLGDYDMGDYGKDTKFTNESNSVRYNNFNTKGGISEVDNGIRVINGRILAAFPAALKSENEQSYNDSSNSMHLVRHYKLPAKWRNISGTNYQQDGGTYSDEHSNISIGQNDIYKLVDYVFEDSTNQQFVVPFIVIDAKNIHLLPNYSEVDKTYLGKAGMMSNFTDNRYGQVVEKIKEHNKDNKGPYEYSILSSKERVKDENGKNTDISKYEYIVPKAEVQSLDYDKDVFDYRDRDITYFDKSDDRAVVSMSPIEVLTIPQTMEDKEIRKIIFGDEGDYKLISMRIYKDSGIYSGKDMYIRVATNEGVPLGTDEENHPLMWSFRKAEINDNTKNIEGSVEVVNDYYEYPEYLNRHEDKTDLNSPLISNHIVNYE